jgi:hypothetical protein
LKTKTCDVVALDGSITAGARDQATEFSLWNPPLIPCAYRTNTQFDATLRVQ